MKIWKNTDPEHARRKGLGFLLMVLSWALIFASLSFLLEGKSISGRIWIVGTVVGLWLLVISTQIWTERRGTSQAQSRATEDTHSERVVNVAISKPADRDAERTLARG